MLPWVTIRGTTTVGPFWETHLATFDAVNQGRVRIPLETSRADHSLQREGERGSDRFAAVREPSLHRNHIRRPCSLLGSSESWPHPGVYIVNLPRYLPELEPQDENNVCVNCRGRDSVFLRQEYDRRRRRPAGRGRDREGTSGNSWLGFAPWTESGIRREEGGRVERESVCVCTCMRVLAHMWAHACPSAWLQ